MGINVSRYQLWSTRLDAGLPSDGSYGIEQGLIYSFPVTCQDGEYSIVQGLDSDEFSREKMEATMAELKEERDEVKDLL